MKMSQVISLVYRHRFLWFYALIWPTVLLAPALAQDTGDFEVWGNMSSNMGLISKMEYQVEDLEESELFGRVGVIGGTAPEYSGSDEHKFAYAPNIHTVWNGFLFIKGRKLGVQVINSKHFYSGAFVHYTSWRSENNDRLEGPGDVSRTFTSGGYLNFRYEGIRLKTEVRHDYFNEGHGTLMIANFGSRVPWKDPFFYLGIETTWASRKYMDTFIGLNNFQAMQSGLVRYNAGSGIRDVSLNLGSAYKLDEHWSLSGQLRFQRLLGDAVDSPMVRDVGSENNFVAGLGLNYAF